MAIERENFPVESIGDRVFEEQAFGRGSVSAWDEGSVEFDLVSERTVILRLTGRRMSGKYEFRRMHWYPGNRWILTKTSG